jgi:glycogen debranching enzyme
MNVIDRFAQIAINPTRFTMYNRGTLLITDRDGAIGEGVTGLYTQDTRCLSCYRITIDQIVPVLHSSVRSTYFAVTHTFSNHALGAPSPRVPAGSLVFRLDRAVGDGLHEDFAITNYSGRTVDLRLAISLDADFADIMQVHRPVGFVPHFAEPDWTRPTTRIIDVDWDDDFEALTFSYRKKGFERNLTYQLLTTGSPLRRLGKVIMVDLTLAPGATWHARSAVQVGPATTLARVDAERSCLQRAATPTSQEVQLWADTVARIIVPDQRLQRTFDQAVVDFASLRLEKVGDGWFPAAGVPWFAAVFGRDSIWASLQALLVSSDFGRGTLDRLAALQGDQAVPERDEEPGKLPHEVRAGELTYFGRLPFAPYYGTADASLLYVILLAAEHCFVGDVAFTRAHLAVAERCLAWAAGWGDADGDGFIEYSPHTTRGYHNQGWKDAFDAIVYPSGGNVPDPIALCEIQGYHYAALRSMAYLLRRFGRSDEAATRDREADELFQRFNQAFWLPDLGFYALGLDPDKKPIKTIASNPGQLLWCGIVPNARAAALVQRLFAPDLFSGWGIRTLSAHNPAYNPISYQLGSIWPHDNGIIARGLKRYGFWREANRIARGIFDAAAHFENHSLPELFGGLERQVGDPPVPYIDANVPQAWAAGSVFHLFETILGVAVDAASGVVSVQPTLPDWLPEIELRGLRVAQTQLDLRFVGAGPASRVEVLRHDGPARLVVRPSQE